MKSYILFGLLLAMTLAARTKQQQALFNDSLVTKLKASNLGRAILMMGEVHAKQSNPNYNRLFLALDQLGEALQSRLQTEQREYTSEQTSVEADRQQYVTLVEQYTTQVAQFSVDLRVLLHTRTELESELDNKRNELTQTKRLSTQLENLMSINRREFERQSNDINAAVTVIDQAIRLLEQSRNSAFIQTNSVEFQQTADEMHKSLSNLQSQRFLYHPIAQTLVQIASQGFVEQQNLQRAIRLLQTLRDSINETRLSLQTTYENERNVNQELLNAYSAKLNQLGEVIIPGLQGDIETKNGEVITKRQLQDEAQANLNEAQDNLDAVNRNWDGRTTNHNTLVQEFNHELEVLGECIESLNAGGIKRQI